LWFFSSQADILIGGKMLGKELLGIYSVSMHVASLPVQRIASLINSVAVAAFASIQDDRKRVAEYLLKSIRLVSLVSFPVLWGIASVSDEAVSVLLGPTWSDAVVPLRLLALLMPLRMMGALLPSATDGMGRPDISLRNLTLASVLMPPAFFVGCHWGIVGLAASWVLIYPLIVLQNLHRTAQAVGIRTTCFFTAVWKPLAAGAFMVGTVTAARLALPLDLPDPARLGLLVASGIAAYGGASLVMNREGLLELRDLLRRS
jgi:O-antigen/teichoic acid export membrane protein